MYTFKTGPDWISSDYIRRFSNVRLNRFLAEYFALDDYNVVCVEWSSLALDWPYFTAGMESKNIGDHVADLITMLTNCTTQTMENIHIIGLSMGAHIAGFAGKKLDGQVHRITGNHNVVDGFNSQTRSGCRFSTNIISAKRVK